MLADCLQEYIKIHVDFFYNIRAHETLIFQVFWESVNGINFAGNIFIKNVSFGRLSWNSLTKISSSYETMSLPFSIASIMEK